MESTGIVESEDGDRKVQTFIARGEQLSKEIRYLSEMIETACGVAYALGAARELLNVRSQQLPVVNPQGRELDPFKADLASAVYTLHRGTPPAAAIAYLRCASDKLDRLVERQRHK